MNGLVDEELRALISINVSRGVDSLQESIEVWVDTAFNGGLVIPRERIDQLGLKKASSTEAILADGQLVELETYSCLIEWFGKSVSDSDCRERRTVPIARDDVSCRSQTGD